MTENVVARELRLLRKDLVSMRRQLDLLTERMTEPSENTHRLLVHGLEGIKGQVFQLRYDVANIIIGRDKAADPPLSQELNEKLAVLYKEEIDRLHADMDGKSGDR